MNVFKQKALLGVVFITGACVLVLEVVAVRILSPFFGNTIYSYSSILSVILGALSVGYYYGGTYADRFPDYRHFFKIILYSGVAVIFLQFLTIFVIPRFAYTLPFTSGPLIVSAILFALPSLLLGTLSPYAIKLQEVTQPEIGVGKLSGEVFFFSTIGSIAGSLLTGFYLIPNFGVQTIVLGTGATLIILGILGSLQFGKVDSLVKKKSLIVLLSFSFLLSAFILFATSTLATGVVFITDGVYEHITVFDTQIRGKDSRLLMQDRSASSAIIKETGESPFEYAPYYKLYSLMNKLPENALFIGAGAYTFPKSLMSELPDVHVAVVDIEPKLFDISKKYFGLEDTSRLTNHVADGRRFLVDSKNHYDYIYSDVYKTVYSIPTHITTQEYFQLVKSRLSPDGIFIVNVIGTLQDEKESLALSEMKTFQSVFPNSYFFAVTAPDSSATQNIIFLGINGNNTTDLSKETIIDAVTNTPIDLKAHEVDRSKFDLSKQIIFTDDYAPIDSYSKNLLQTSEEKKSVEEKQENSMIQSIKQQVSFGPRFPKSDGHTKFVSWLDTELHSISDTNVVRQDWKQKGLKDSYDLSNFIFRIQPNSPKRIILGTHFDTLKHSVDGGQPIPGANNGASGTAVLLELAKELQKNPPKVGVDLIFFDAEEGDPEIKLGSFGWTPWGSTYFGEHLSDIYKNAKPDHAVIIDLVCSKNAKFYYEVNSLASANTQTKKLWDVGSQVDPSLFIKDTKYSVMDDHTVLQKYEIPSLLVIDFGYPELHSTTDTVEKCSGETLEKTKETLLKYVYSL
jgi:spermidine synthase